MTPTSDYAYVPQILGERADARLLSFHGAQLWALATWTHHLGAGSRTKLGVPVVHGVCEVVEVGDVTQGKVPVCFDKVVVPARRSTSQRVC